MKRNNSLLKNENVVATLVVGGVFLITGLLTMFAIYVS